MRSKLMIMVCLLNGLNLFAGNGVGTRGGGDSCQNEIEKHRLEIRGWIQRDEASELDFSKAKVPSLTYQSYKKSMLAALEDGNVVITCYLDPAKINDPSAKAIAKKENVSYKAIMIGNPARPTTCINYEDADGISHIDCNYDKIVNQSSTGNPNYILTHHEFASIAGVEKRTNSYNSDFSISNQLDQYEHWKSVKFLGKKINTNEKPFSFRYKDESFLVHPKMITIKIKKILVHGFITHYLVTINIAGMKFAKNKDILSHIPYYKSNAIKSKLKFEKLVFNAIKNNELILIKPLSKGGLGSVGSYHGTISMENKSINYRE